MEIDKTYYNRFPTVLRDALLNGRVAFPKSLQIQYEDTQVYRGVKYNQKKTDIDKTDFYSHAERNNPSIPYDPDQITSYGCSCFMDLEEMHMITKFPTKNKAIAKGMIRQQYGPCDISKENSHVNIFLYVDADISKEFEVIEKCKKNGLN